MGEYEKGYEPHWRSNPKDNISKYIYKLGDLEAEILELKKIIQEFLDENKDYNGLEVDDYVRRWRLRQISSF